MNIGSVRGEGTGKDGEDAGIGSSLAVRLALSKTRQHHAALGLQRLLALAAQHHPNHAFKAAGRREYVDEALAIERVPQTRCLRMLRQPRERGIGDSGVGLPKLAQHVNGVLGRGAEHTRRCGEWLPTAAAVQLGSLVHVLEAAVAHKAA